MSPPQDLRRVYYHIIDDVIAKMKPEFVQENVDESVLHTIRQRWAQKLTERGIISEVEQEDVKKEEDREAPGQPAGNGAAASRKRPHDGVGPSGPIAKQEANINPAALAQQPQHLLQQAGVNMLQQQRQLPPGVTPQQLQQLQQQQHRLQQSMQAGVSMQQQLAAQAAAGIPMQQTMPRPQLGALQGLAGGLGGLPAGIQMSTAGAAPANNLQLGMQGLARLQQQGVQHGMPTMQGIQAAQLQQLMNNPALMSQLHAQRQQQQQQQQRQQLLVQQQLVQQQLVQQQQRQQQQQQVYNNSIPQRDGSADTPGPLAAVAAAAGVDVHQLNALVPPQVASSLAAAHARCSTSSSKLSAASTRPATTAAASATTAVLQGRANSRVRSSKTHQQRPRKHHTFIPQVDGNGDDDEDGLDEEDEAEDFVGDEEVAEEEEPADDEDDDEDREALARLDEEIIQQEEADNENIENVGFALYEKVQRSKNRWRCSLKFGVFYINGKEYMFNKASTDLTF